MTWVQVSCPLPGCTKTHPLRQVRANHKPVTVAPAAAIPPAHRDGRDPEPVRRGPAAPFDGPWVSPLRTVESPRTGVDVLAGSTPPADPASTSVQAASPQPSVVRGSTD